MSGASERGKLVVRGSCPVCGTGASGIPCGLHALADKRLAIKYLTVCADKCWDEEAVRVKLHTLRAKDEETEVANGEEEN